MSWKLATAPTVEPVSADELKSHLRIDGTDEDAYLAALIEAAREHVEEITWRALISQSWDFYLSEFKNPIKMPRPRLISVTHIKYYDTAGVQQTLADTVYELDTASEPGFVRLKYGQSWPTCRGHEDDIVIQFKAGYGTTAASVPRPIRQAILLLAGHWFENREPVALGTTSTLIPMTVDSLLAPYRCADLLAEFP